MSIFEVKSIFISNAILDSGRMIPYRKMNIQIDINVEERQDLDAKRITEEEIINQLGKAVSEAFAKKNLSGSDPEGKKFINPLMTTEAGEKEFGWWKLEDK